VIISQTEKQLCETIHKIIGIFDSLMRFESATGEGARREPSILIHDLGVALRRGRWRHKVGIRRCACPDQGRRARFVWATSARRIVGTVHMRSHRDRDFELVSRQTSGWSGAARRQSAALSVMNWPFAERRIQGSSRQVV